MPRAFPANAAPHALGVHDGRVLAADTSEHGGRINYREGIFKANRRKGNPSKWRHRLKMP
jgi:hypothetical protein